MDLQAVIQKAEREIELRRSELDKRSQALDKREVEIESRIKIAQEAENKATRDLELTQRDLVEIKSLEAIKRSDDEVSERMMFADRREKDSKKLLDDAETRMLEANRIYEEARKLKAEISKEASEFKGKIVDNIKKMIEQA